MPSAPFGQSPTLCEYMDWAKTQGCTVKSGYGALGKKTQLLTLIENADGSRHVQIVGTKQTERLVPTVVANYDRRLGLKSPFPALHVPPSFKK